MSTRTTGRASVAYCRRRGGLREGARGTTESNGIGAAVAKQTAVSTQVIGMVGLAKAGLIVMDVVVDSEQ